VERRLSAFVLGALFEALYAGCMQNVKGLETSVAIWWI